ncbi:MAG TPA: FtsX-like permease family protein [Gemmatimonadaceae bacterium]|jgi:predicted permease
MPISTESIRLSARTLRKQPVFATVVILSLALAIALNTMMYGVLDAMIHPRLDIRKPEQLYWVRFYGDYKFVVDNRHRDAAVTSGMHSYSAITREDGGFGSGSLTLLEHGQNVTEGAVDGVGANYFDVLGPHIIAGRTFIPSDSTATSSPIVLGEDAATHLFPNDVSAAVGATISIDRVPHVVIGVVSAESDFPHSRNVAWGIAPYSNHGMYFRLIRLRDGASPADAERELDVIAARIRILSGEGPRDVAFRFHAAADPDFQARPLHYAVMFAVFAVLLVACANLANLQLARGIGRRRDLALRAALGATRARIVRHLLTESVLLATCGLTLGLLLTYLGGRLLTASIPPSMGSFVMQPQMSWRVLAFAIAATVLCLVLVGVAPAIYVSKADPNELLKSGAGTGATKRNRRRYGVLVAMEMAFALALTSAAVLTVRTALAATQEREGYDPSHLATGLVGGTARKGTSIRYSDALGSLANRVKGVKGVVDAAASTNHEIVNQTVTVEDPGGVREFKAAGNAVTMVSPSYLRTYGYRIVRGRDFLDGESNQGEVIVDEHTAQVLWPNANPIGAQIKFGDLASEEPYVRVVGVFGEQPQFAKPSSTENFMRNVHSLGRVFYLPGKNDTLVVNRTFFVSFVARGQQTGETLATVLRQSFQLEGDVFARVVVSMDDAIGITRARQSANFISALFSLFAALGVGLAAFGVYGVVAHSVAERRRELGVRIALGATARDILHAVLRESFVVALAGIAGGLLLTKYSRHYLLTVAREDDIYSATLFGLVALALLLAAIAAAMVPAMRATRVDPTESLRND